MASHQVLCVKSARLPLGKLRRDEVKRLECAAWDLGAEDLVAMAGLLQVRFCRHRFSLPVT